METTTAPEWIRDKERGYDRFRRRWMCVRDLVTLAYFAGIVLLFVGPKPMAAFCLFWTMAAECLIPGKRARRYEDAGNVLRAAIRRYELDLDRREAALAEADQQASQMLRHDRKRRAPQWIRRKVRRYRLELLAWIAPADLILIFMVAGALGHWTWIRPWHAFLMVGIFIPVLLLVLFAPRTRKIQKAKATLSAAIEQYEFDPEERDLNLTGLDLP